MEKTQDKAAVVLELATAQRVLGLLEEARDRGEAAGIESRDLGRDDAFRAVALMEEACGILRGPLADALGGGMATGQAPALLEALAAESRDWSDTGMVFVEDAEHLAAIGRGFTPEDARALADLLAAPEASCLAGAIEVDLDPQPGDPIITCYTSLPEAYEAYRQQAAPAADAGEARRLRELLARYQAAIVDIARELGCDPDASVADPDYYYDMASEAAGNLKASLGKSVTPKGDTLLASFGADALIFRGQQAVEPYVVAHGYNPERGDWAAGSYYSSPVDAWCEADPRAIAGSALYWEREDIAEALRDRGLPATDFNIDTVIGEAEGMVPVKLRAYEYGSEFIRECISDCGHMLEREAPVAFGVVQEAPAELSRDLAEAARRIGGPSGPAPDKARRQ